MADGNRLDVIGRAIVEQAYIRNNSSGAQVDVTKFLMDLDIYEDIYSPFVYCDMTVIDYEEFARSFPLIGEDEFVISFRSIGGKTINYQFMLYKLDQGGFTATNSAKGFVIRGVTLERFSDAGITVSRGYTGTYAGIAGQIYDDFLKKMTNLEFTYEPSLSVGRYVVPQITPLTAIEYCRSRAVSTSDVKSPFVFFRNSDGYLFMSMNGLFNMMASKPEAQVVHTYSSVPLPALYNEMQGNYNTDIIEFNVVSYYDTISKMDNGGYNNHVYSFDLLTKSFVLRKIFNLSERGGMQLGGEAYYNRKNFVSLFDNQRVLALYVPTNSALEINDANSTTKDLYPDAMGEMIAYTNLVSEYNAQYTIYGDSNVTAGNVMKVLVMESTDLQMAQTSKPRKEDPMFSGNFLCAKVRHSLQFNENVDYYCMISGINGARNTSIDDIPKEIM